MYLKPILGKGVYFELQDQVNNGDLTPANQALILKIAPCLSWYAVYQALPFHRNAIVNKGVTQDNSDNSTNPSFEEFANTQAYVRNTADFYKRELLEYLCECRKEYPLWTPFKGCGCGDLPANFGFFFPK